jgi:hypothetical protein
MTTVYNTEEESLCSCYTTISPVSVATQQPRETFVVIMPVSL